MGETDTFIASLTHRHIRKSLHTQRSTEGYQLISSQRACGCLADWHTYDLGLVNHLISL